MADVDDFKRFNDAHGHQAGDEVLRSIAKLLRRRVRDMDLVARYGGEEFAVILPGTTLDDASKAALRACTAIEETHFRHDGQDLHVTASFGVAEVPGSRDGAALVGRADQALYAAKSGGRNRVFFHDGEAVHHLSASQQPVLSAAVNHPPRGPAPTESKSAEELPPLGMPRLRTPWFLSPRAKAHSRNCQAGPISASRSEIEPRNGSGAARLSRCSLSR